jgi:hypothetical protein
MSISPEPGASPSTAEFLLRRARRTRALAHCVTNVEVKAELDARAQEYEASAVCVLKRPVDPGSERGAAARLRWSSIAATQVVHMYKKIRIAVTALAMELGGFWRSAPRRTAR